MSSSRRTRLAQTAGALALPLAGLAAWEVLRRRDRRVLGADPEWPELSRRPRGRAVEVVSADGTAIHAEVFGPDGAPTIVLCHGWTCDIRFWHFQIRDLSAEFRVVAYDQRGHGRSGRPQGGAYTADALADDLQAVLEGCVPAGERCVVAGHSMGGMTIVAWAGRHGDEVERRLAAAMICNSGVGDLSAQSLIIQGVIAKRLLNAPVQALLGRPNRLPAASTPLSRRLFRHFVMSPGVSEARVAFCEQQLIDCPAEVRAGFGRLFPTLDLYADVARLVVPTVIVACELDRLTPPWHARKLAETLPHVVELAELPGAAHMGPVEVPEEVTRLLRTLAHEHLGAPRLSAAGA